MKAAKEAGTGGWQRGLLGFLPSACLLTTELFPTGAEVAPKALGDGSS